MKKPASGGTRRRHAEENCSRMLEGLEPRVYMDNTPESASLLPVGPAEVSRTGQVSEEADPVDYFRFTLGSRSHVVLRLDGMNGDGDLRLFRERDFIVRASVSDGSTPETIDRVLPAGAYYIRVEAFDGGTVNYRLRASATPTGAAISPDSDPGAAEQLIAANGRMRRADSITPPTDQVDTYRFTLAAATRLDVSLIGLNSDLNVRILNAALATVADFDNPGAMSEAGSVTLQPGNYLIQVGGVDGASQYELELNAGGPSSHSRVVDGSVSQSAGGAATRVSLQRPDGDVIAPGVPTWVVIHGRDNSPESPLVNELVGAVGQAIVNGESGARQVLTLDWREGADATNRPWWAIDFTGEGWIRPTAEWVARQLAALGISGANLNLVGHSWGAVMCAEIARAISEVTGAAEGTNAIVALDPAIDATGPSRALISGVAAGLGWGAVPIFLVGQVFVNMVSSPAFDTETVDFAAHSAYSVALRSSVLGSVRSVMTADESYWVNLNGTANPVEKHRQVMSVVARMLSTPGGGADWVIGGAGRAFNVNGGPYGYSHSEADGALRIRIQGPATANTYGAEAWVRTARNFNDGANHLINFTWSADVNASHVDGFAIQVTNGDIPGGNDPLWWTSDSVRAVNLYETLSGTGAPAPHANGQRDMGPVTWSVLIDAAARTAALYRGRNLTGPVQSVKPLESSQPWFLRFLTMDLSSSGYPGSDNSMFLHDYECFTEGPDGTTVLTLRDTFDDDKVAGNDVPVARHFRLSRLETGAEGPTSRQSGYEGALLASRVPGSTEPRYQALSLRDLTPSGGGTIIEHVVDEVPDQAPGRALGSIAGEHLSSHWIGAGNLRDAYAIRLDGSVNDLRANLSGVGAVLFACRIELYRGNTLLAWGPSVRQTLGTGEYSLVVISTHGGFAGSYDLTIRV